MGDFTYEDVKRQQALSFDRCDDPVTLASALAPLLDSKLLEITTPAVPTFLACVGVASRDYAVQVFWEAIRKLVRGQDRVTLFADGPADQLSFGFAWYAPEDTGSPLGRTYFRSAPWLVGGLIYRGPATSDIYTEHSWSIHT